MNQDYMQARMNDMLTMADEMQTTVNVELACL